MITDINHITAKDIERRIEETHERWFRDSMQLCQMANLSMAVALTIMTAELLERAVRAVEAAGTSPEEAGEMFAKYIRMAREENAKPTR